MLFDTQVLAFAGIAFLLTVTPGVDTVLVLRSVLFRGLKSGLLAALGVCTGLFVHATLSALGLSFILLRSAEAFELVKLLGAAYLIYLGVQTLWGVWTKANDHAGPNGLEMAPNLQRQAFREGLLTNVLNPKVAIFYLAFLPQFISPGDPVLAKSVLLAAVHFVMGIVWLSSIATLLGRVRGWFMKPVVQSRLEALTGLVFIGFGLSLAFERR